MNGFLFIKAAAEVSTDTFCLPNRKTFCFPTPFLTTYLYFDKKAPEKCKYSSQAYLMCKPLFINALQNLLFCVPKAAVLHRKSVGFASQKSRFRNAKTKLWFFLRIIFTESKLLPTSVIGFLEYSSFPRSSR